MRVRHIRTGSSLPWPSESRAGQYTAIYLLTRPTPFSHRAQILVYLAKGAWRHHFTIHLNISTCPWLEVHLCVCPNSLSVDNAMYTWE